MDAESVRKTLIFLNFLKVSKIRAKTAAAFKKLIGVM